MLLHIIKAYLGVCYPHVHVKEGRVGREVLGGAADPRKTMTMPHSYSQPSGEKRNLNSAKIQGYTDTIENL